LLDELVARVAVVEHRLVSDDDRPALRRFVAGLFGPQLAATGWDAAPGESDAVRLRRTAAFRAMALVARDPSVIAEAVARLDRWLAGDRAALEPNLHEAAVTAAARGGDRARQDRFRALFHAETDPAFRRRYLMAVASFEDPVLGLVGIDHLFVGDAVPLQDSAFYLGALLGNRSVGDAAWARLERDWDRFYGRIRGAPMLTRRVVEAMGAMVERRQLAAVEAFLAGHPLEEARQATAQTLERLRQDVALRERALPDVSRWLAGRSKARG
jgi:puromycin-sensitive aminopeptidase